MLEWMGLFGDTPHHGVNTIAGTIRKMMTGYTSTKGHTTRAEEMEFASRHTEALAFAFEVVSRKTNRVALSPVLASVARAYYHVDRVCLRRFAAVLSTGVMDGKADLTVITLREFC